ncbi:MAG: pesticidal protein Cry7Aa [bacterium]
MIKVKKHGVILAPTRKKFEAKGVLNPAVYQEGDLVHVIYRAVDKNHVSRLGYAKFEKGTKLLVRWEKPFFEPKFKYESKGTEDPRITKIKDIIYMTYVAHDGKNAQIAYAYGKHLFDLKRGGIISPQIQYAKAGKYFRSCKNKLKDDYYFMESYYREYSGEDVLIWEKDGLLFPEKIRGKYVLTHRILPDIQIVYFKDFKELKTKKFWIEYLKDFDQHVVLEGKHGFEERHIGGGAPPIKTDDGWLMIYHGVEESNKRRVYHAAAALLDLKNPSRVLARLPYPLFSPDKDYELKGNVNNVVFPSGTAIIDNRLFIYYGAADNKIAVASIGLNYLLDELRRFKV